MCGRRRSIRPPLRRVNGAGPNAVDLALESRVSTRVGPISKTWNLRLEDQR